MLKFFLGGQAGRGALLPQLRTFRELYAERLRIYEEIRDSEPRPTRDEFTLAALRYGVARARAAVDWADETLRAFEQ